MPLVAVCAAIGIGRSKGERESGSSRARREGVDQESADTKGTAWSQLTVASPKLVRCSRLSRSCVWAVPALFLLRSSRLRLRWLRLATREKTTNSNSISRSNPPAPFWAVAFVPGPGFLACVPSLSRQQPSPSPPLIPFQSHFANSRPSLEFLLPRHGGLDPFCYRELPTAPAAGYPLLRPGDPRAERRQPFIWCRQRALKHALCGRKLGHPTSTTRLSPATVPAHWETL